MELTLIAVMVAILGAIIKNNANWTNILGIVLFCIVLIVISIIFFPEPDNN